MSASEETLHEAFISLNIFVLHFFSKGVWLQVIRS